MNEVIYQVYRDRIERGYSHEEAEKAAWEYDRILRGEE